MFKIREDRFRRRDMVDRLKITFATAASGGLGLGAAWLAAGATGAAVYTGVTFYALFQERRLWASVRSLHTDHAILSRPFTEMENFAKQMGEKAGITPPPIFHSPHLTEEDNAFTDGINVIMGQNYVRKPEAPETLVTLAHEIGHIKNRHVQKSHLLNAFESGTYNSAALLVLGCLGTGLDTPPILAFLFATPVLGAGQALLHRSIRRLNEFQADRFAARMTDCPLDLAIERESSPSLYPNSEACTLLQKFTRTHPPDSHRIKAIVQICKRVPDPVSGP